MKNETENSDDSKARRLISLVGCKQEVKGVRGVKGLNLHIAQWSFVKLCLNFISLAAKNQGLTITKNSTATTLHNDQPFGSSQGSSNSRFNIETTSINGFQTSKNELDIAMLQILDPHLRPVPPVPNEPTSQKVYKEHMDLAQEYFKVRQGCTLFSSGLTKTFFTESNRNRLSDKAQGKPPAKHVTWWEESTSRHLQ